MCEKVPKMDTVRSTRGLGRVESRVRFKANFADQVRSGQKFEMRYLSVELRKFSYCSK